MSEALRNSGKQARLAMAGVAAILLGGCADASRMGDPFADPFKTSASRFDSTPTGTVNQPRVASYAPAPPPGFDPGAFFSDAFKPFDDNSAPPAPPRVAAPAAPRVSAPRPIPTPSAAVESSPLASPASPVFRPAAPSAPASIVRASPNAVGGWTAEGGVPVVVAQGESAEAIATRYGVPTATLLSVNGYANRGQVTPGTRLVIPVYHANGAARVAAAPQAPATVAPRPAQVARLEAPKLEAPKLVTPVAAPKPDAKAAAAAALADKRAKAAQAKADEAAKAQVAQAQVAQVKVAQVKVAQAQVVQAKAAETKAAQAKLAEAKAAETKAKLAKAEGDKARAVKEAAAKQAAPKQVDAKQVDAKQIAAAKPPAVETQALAAAPKPAAKTQQIANAAPVLPAAPSAPVKAPDAAADATASLPSAASNAGGDSANPEFRWPARGRVIQAFGSGGNDGINIAVPEGTQVKAAEGGVVAYAGSELKGYGNLVLIRHPNGFVSAYANNGSINVKRGETVKRGQTIALSGQTGNVSSPQLHFELRKGQKPVDPSNYLAGL